VATPAEKGDALQQAVSWLERHILSTSPALKEKTFLFQEKRIVCVGGVHHEIDIFVTVDLANGYRAIYIFECKNWKKAVGKNEVIAFSEKVDAVQAAHGYFVATSFSRDAEAQARKDPRITLLVATEHDPAGIPIPNDLHLTVTTPRNVQATFLKRGSDGKDIKPVDLGAARCQLKGEEIDLRAYLAQWSEAVASEDVLRFPSARLGPGSYDRVAESTRDFQPGELQLDGADIERIKQTLAYSIAIYRPPIISRFEVESRGRVIQLAPVTIPQGVTFQMGIIEGT
jgi:Restriction endonuclease